MSDTARILVLFEDMNGKFDAIMEYVKDIPDIKRRVTRLEEKVDLLQIDMTMIKAIVKQHSRDLADLKARL